LPKFPALEIIIMSVDTQLYLPGLEDRKPEFDINADPKDFLKSLLYATNGQIALGEPIGVRLPDGKPIRRYTEAVLVALSDVDDLYKGWYVFSDDSLPIKVLSFFDANSDEVNPVFALTLTRTVNDFRLILTDNEVQGVMAVVGARSIIDDMGRVIGFDVGAAWFFPSGSYMLTHDGNYCVAIDNAVQLNSIIRVTPEPVVDSN